MQKLFIITLIVFFASLAEVKATEKAYGGGNRATFIPARFSAVGEGASAHYKDPLPLGNPALIGSVDDIRLITSYENHYINTFSTFTSSVTLPLDGAHRSGLFIGYIFIPNIDSVSADSVSKDGIPIGVEISSVTASELFIHIPYGRKLLGRSWGDIYVGGALSVNRRRLVSWTGHGIGFDVGASAILNSGLSGGFYIHDVFTRYMHWSPDYKELVLPHAYASLGYLGDLGEKHRFQLGYRTPELFGNGHAELKNSFGKSDFDGTPEHLRVRKDLSLLFTHASYSGELNLYDRFTLRTGYSAGRTLSFGGGVKVADLLSIDIAYRHTASLPGSYGVSMLLNF